MRRADIKGNRGSDSSRYY